MGSVTTCKSCGFTAGGVRCPRCNALKVVGCTGSCTLCKIGESCATKGKPSEQTDKPAEQPSGSARHAH